MNDGTLSTDSVAMFTGPIGVIFDEVAHGANPSNWAKYILRGYHGVAIGYCPAILSTRLFDTIEELDAFVADNLVVDFKTTILPDPNEI